MEIKTILDIIANQGFPIALSILLIYSYRQVYAGDSNCPERGISTGPGKY